jgi:non-heme chloroperoxidase
MLWIALLTMLSGSLFAQDVAGDWQGTLKSGRGLRVVVEISKAETGVWNAMLYSVDQGPDGVAANSVSVEGSALKLSIESLRATFEGKVSEDRRSIKGTWTQGQPTPLELERATKEATWHRDNSPHAKQFVAVDKNVKLEVLDWGGSGRPLVLLTGLGNTAHIFDEFAPKLARDYHVYGITRRGYGASTAPDSGYSADRLGDDVLAVIDALKLNRPVLAGHSIAGEELSSVGSRHPEKVAGLIYLDAGYPYAYYDRSRGDLLIDALELQRKLGQLLPGGSQDPKGLVRELLESLPQMEKDLKERQKELESGSSAASGFMPAAPRAILAGQQKYTEIRAPALAIYAFPNDVPTRTLDSSKASAAAEGKGPSLTERQAKAFETGVPTARVVRLAHANHYVFRSNEEDVLREMKAFIASLP